MQVISLAKEKTVTNGSNRKDRKDGVKDVIKEQRVGTQLGQKRRSDRRCAVELLHFVVSMEEEGLCISVGKKV